jgi:hypothetical protein
VIGGNVAAVPEEGMADRLELLAGRTNKVADDLHEVAIKLEKLNDRMTASSSSCLG